MILAFFRNSICFMCFWFGLEILRLVYKKAFFEILNSFYLIWPFILRKSSTNPYKSWKKISFKLGVQGYQKKWNFALISKMSWVWQKRKNLQKNWLFRDLGSFKKKMSAKKSFETSWHQSSTHFKNQRKILLLLIPFAYNFEETFSNSYKGWCYFFWS